MQYFSVCVLLVQVIQEAWRKLAQMAQLESRTQADHKASWARVRDRVRDRDCFRVMFRVGVRSQVGWVL